MLVFAQPIEQYPKHLAFTTVPTVVTNPVNQVSASSPALNLLTRDPTQVMLATAPSVTITWDFGRARKFNVLSLVSTNLASDSIWTLDISNDGTTWTSVFNSRPSWPQLTATVAVATVYADEDLDPRRMAAEKATTWYYSAAAQSARYVRISVNNSTVGNISIGRLFVGREFRPKTSYQYGSSLKFDDTGSKDRTDRGSAVFDDGRTIIGANVKMDFMSTDEVYDYVYEFNVWRGSTRELMCCLDVNTQKRLHKNVLYCTIVDGRTVTADQFEAWSQAWTLESI
jgi:hypothetical protein